MLRLATRRVVQSVRYRSSDLVKCTNGFSITKAASVNPILSLDAKKLSFNGVEKQSQRFYGGKPPMTLSTVRDRVLLILKLFDKVDPEKVTVNSRFFEDLGMDSLDFVEMIVEVEQEFMFEIPDGDADRFKTVADLIQYVCDKEDVYE